jgi:hypothetical protein
MLENSRTCLTENIKQTTIMGNYTKYRYYKGENENPLTVQLIAPRYSLASRICFLTLLISKRIFFTASLITEWAINLWFFAFREDDKEYLTEKNRIPVLELWLEYLYDTNILVKENGSMRLKKILLYYSLRCYSIKIQNNN